MSANTAGGETFWILITGLQKISEWLLGTILNCYMSNNTAGDGNFWKIGLQKYSERLLEVRNSLELLCILYA